MRVSAAYWSCLRRSARPHGVERIRVAAGRPILRCDTAPAAGGFEVAADEREVLLVGRLEPHGDGLGEEAAVRERDDERRPGPQDAADLAEEAQRMRDYWIDTAHIAP